MDFTISSSDIVDNHEDMLIHFYYHILDFDYRCGIFTDQSSICDMGSTGLKKLDYEVVAAKYHELDYKSMEYTQGQKAYNLILNNHWDRMVYNKIKSVYNIEFNTNVHLLIDIIKLLEEKYPNRNWANDNIFIIKMLDNRAKKQEENNIKEKEQTNVLKLNLRKKLTREEILKSTNDFLIAKELNIGFKEAHEIAQKNYIEKMKGKIFEPYIPENEDE
jgi:hypothetical protein